MPLRVYRKEDMARIVTKHCSPCGPPGSVGTRKQLSSSTSETTQHSDDDDDILGVSEKWGTVSKFVCFVIIFQWTYVVFWRSFSDKPKYHMFGCISPCTPSIFAFMVGCYTMWYPLYVHSWLDFTPVHIWLGFISMFSPFWKNQSPSVLEMRIPIWRFPKSWGYPSHHSF